MSIDPGAYTEGGRVYRVNDLSSVEAIYYDGSNSGALIAWVRARAGSAWISRIAENADGDYTCAITYDAGRTHLAPGWWLVYDQGAFVAFGTVEFTDYFHKGPGSRLVYDAEAGLSYVRPVMLANGRMIQIRYGRATGQGTVRWEDVRAALGFTDEDETEIEQLRQRQLEACAEFTAAHEAEHGPIPDEAIAEAAAILNALPEDQVTKADVDQYHRYAPRHAAP